MRRRAVLITAAATAVALATGGAALAAGEAGPPTIDVLVKDTSMKMTGAVPASGKVTFVVRNAGTTFHEFVVLKTNTAPRALPMSGKQARETGLVGETAKMARGAVKKLTLTLAPGKYVLLSNLPGDYKRGLVAGLVLKQPPKQPSEPTNVPLKESTVDVSAFEMGFKLSATRVPRGTVTFNVRNDGGAEHDFQIEGKGTEMLAGGQSGTVAVSLTKPGAYLFICTVPGHVGAGMKGTLTVT